MLEQKGKTIFITGGSKGIGEAIGLRFAKEGANVVIAATFDQNKQTSMDAIQEKIGQQGGQTLVMDLDVRDDDAVKLAVDKAYAHFGSFDILVNNVSTFCFNDTSDITPDQFDLLFSTNVRATFLLSQTCLPYLKKASNPHIINISPPLNMQGKWFKHHVAFTMSNYFMSMCTLGMAGEFKRNNIAINSLWPQTTIATTMIKDYFRPQVYSGSRWPTIMADAAYELAKRTARTCTGNFLIDELILREAGITDFNGYAVDPAAPLVQDLFIPEKNANHSHEISLVNHWEKLIK